METKKKPICEFGVKCYRKNPKHFESYSHEEDLNTRHAKRAKKTFKNGPGSREMIQTTLDFPKRPNFSPRSSKPRYQNMNDKNENVRENIVVLRVKRRFDNGHSVMTVVKAYICNKQSKSNFDFKDEHLNDLQKGSEEINVTKADERSALNKNKYNISYVSHSKEDEGSTECSDNDEDPVQSRSWTFIKKLSDGNENAENVENLEKNAPEQIIKTLYLVNMPSDFYSFFDFCKTIDQNDPRKALELCEMKLVGPFEILSGEIQTSSIDQEISVCHWRFYYDPPEFQTVLACESGFHIGYWRDDPKENPNFLASNNPGKDCIFKIEADNIFATVYHYLNEFIKTSDVFKKAKLIKLQNALCDWAKTNNFLLDKKSLKIKERQKKVVSKTFHRAGIVVPVEASTALGYRPLIETEANIRRICNLIINSDGSEQESLWENLQPLINAANIANDECDFGNSLELGIDLFCMGSDLFHNTVEHLLSTAYSLLNRSEFAEIITAHLKFRRKATNLSVF